jgi:hypothetical protein
VLIALILLALLDWVIRRQGIDVAEAMWDG